jgi:hypothetical protein
MTKSGATVAQVNRIYQHSFRLINSVDDGGLIGYAQYIAGYLGTPQPLVTVELKAISDAVLTSQLAAELSTRFTIVDTANPWQTQVNGDFFAEYLEDNWDQRGEFVTKLTMTAYLSEQQWILGTSALNIDAILGY